MIVEYTKYSKASKDLPDRIYFLTKDTKEFKNLFIVGSINKDCLVKAEVNHMINISIKTFDESFDIRRAFNSVFRFEIPDFLYKNDEPGDYDPFAFLDKYLDPIYQERAELVFKQVLDTMKNGKFLAETELNYVIQNYLQ